MSYPCTVNDIQPYLLYEYKDKENKYAIGSISRDRFIEVNESSTPVVMEAIKLMDGSKSFDEIDKTVFESTGFSIKSKDLYEILSRADLLSEADNNKAEKSEFETLALKILDFRIEKYKKFFSYLSFLAVPTLFISVLLGIGSCKEKGLPMSCSSHSATALFSKNKTVLVLHYHKNMGGEYNVCRTASQNL